MPQHDVRGLAHAVFLSVWALLVGLAEADAHLAKRPADRSLAAIAAPQTENLRHSEYVCRHGGGEHRKWACWAASSVIRENGQGWLRRELRETMNRLRPPTLPVIDRMIAAAEQVYREQGGGDPWPNCPDPYDGGGYSWQDTKDCESPGWSWYEDPPGYYCGPLQLDPVLWGHIVRRWGVPC